MRLIGIVTLMVTLLATRPAAAQVPDLAANPDRPTATSLEIPSTPSTPSIYHAAQVAVVAANVADLTTTLRGWSVGHVEQNPLIGNHVGRLVGVKAFSVGAQLGAMWVLKKTGHPKAAAWIGLATSTVPTWAAVHNERLTQRTKGGR